MKLLSILLVLLLACLNCSKHQQEVGPQTLTLPLQKETDHFLFYTDALNPASLDSVEQKLEEHYDTLQNRLQPGPLPKIRIAIWTDKEAFAKAQNYLYPGATGYVNGKQEVRVLYVGSNTGIIAVHELVHAITLFMSPTFGNNPRWLWEAVAVYEAKQFIAPKTLPYMVSGDYPTLTVLSNEQGTTQRIYQVGFTIAEFIVKNWGYQGLRSLVKANGDIKNTFGTDNSSFEQQWYSFVKTTYL